MLKIFGNKYKDRTERALKVINDNNIDLTYLQKTCICKLYLENDIGKEIKISPNHFGIKKPAYLKLLDRLFYLEFAEIKGGNPPFQGSRDSVHTIVLKEI